MKAHLSPRGAHPRRPRPHRWPARRGGCHHLGRAGGAARAGRQAAAGRTRHRQRRGRPPRQAWETNGYDANGDGVVDVDLPALGASPTRKDLFVEMDYMSGRLASTAALDRIVAVYAGAPVGNPDGSTGITLHLDAGSARGAAYNLGGGNQVTYDSNLSPSLRQTSDIKNANFDSDRAGVFYYMLWADDYDSRLQQRLLVPDPRRHLHRHHGPALRLEPDGEHERGHLRARVRPRPGAQARRHRPREQQAELPVGDELPLPVRRRPAHLRRRVLRLQQRRSAEPRRVAADRVQRSRYDGRQRLAHQPGTAPTARPSAPGSGAASQGLDWNCDGDTADAGAWNINADNTRSVLSAQNNWANLVFGGGAVGGGGSTGALRAAAPEQGPREVTKQQWVESARGDRARSPARPLTRRTGQGDRVTATSCRRCPLPGGHARGSTGRGPGPPERAPGSGSASAGWPGSRPPPRRGVAPAGSRSPAPGAGDRAGRGCRCCAPVTPAARAR
ncbi:hypothetical protein [Nocardioides convexus]|uniref:hypothetical protein n=1 Tax=Nocardioides convexus TaxID=2712224 RepID=UPI0024187F1F|nr:hypothetical protein [Nocardioides convexus]